MDFFIFLTLTAFAVSIDSMLAGFAIGLKTKKPWFFATIAALATLALCFFATFLAMLASDGYDNLMKIAGAVFFVIIGIANFCKKTEQMPKSVSAKEYVALGFAVGTDAGIANLSVCLLGYTQLWIPFVFAFMHFATVSLGAKLANTKLTGKLKNTNKLSGLILFCLGIFKLLQ